MLFIEFDFIGWHASIGSAIVTYPVNDLPYGIYPYYAKVKLISIIIINALLIKIILKRLRL